MAQCWPARQGDRLITTRFEARIGQGDSFAVIVEPDPTHPVTLVVASINEDRTQALARMRVRLSIDQAARLAAQIMESLVECEGAPDGN